MKYMLLQTPWIPGLMDSLFSIGGITHSQMVVTAVDRCGQRSMNTTNIEIRVSDTRTVEVEDISKLTVALAVLILLPLPF
jgi:hypothetical protein